MRTAFKLYELAWEAALPLLRRNRRLAEGFEQRVLARPLPCADVWIQAASAGEAYLAWSLAGELLSNANPPDVLLTSTTRQGLDILVQAANAMRDSSPKARVTTAYFPFDRPSSMQRALAQVRPRVLVLLEAEIWPALLRAARLAGTRILIINGRLRATSLRHYRLLPGFWRELAPDHVAAISAADAARFRRLFPGCPVEVMHNIKFDCIETDPGPAGRPNPLRSLPAPGTGFLVLGSIRRDEEQDTARLMRAVLAQHPNTLIGLFPRHMHRLAAWQRRLDRLGPPWRLRSQVTAPLAGPAVVLWDVFGELKQAYALAAAAFVGGSLKPLGGQNFLEAMVCGVKPVMGPFWDHFHWVGAEVVTRGLVRMVPDWPSAARRLAADLADPPPREAVRSEALAYIRRRRGGSRLASRVIRHYLDQTPGPRRVPRRPPAQ